VTQSTAALTDSLPPGNWRRHAWGTYASGQDRTTEKDRYPDHADCHSEPISSISSAWREHQSRLIWLGMILLLQRPSRPGAFARSPMRAFFVVVPPSILDLFLMMPVLRQMSATGMPSRPCFKMNAFWASENRDAFTALRFSQPGSQRGKL
jgi:hypothetical protein